MRANKFKTIQWFIVLGTLLTMSSCVEKYWPEIIATDDHFLVVDGKISNLPGPYTIKLSYSSSILDTLFIPISSATVSILDDQGNIEILRETGSGTYITRADGIQGIVGRSYKVTIQLETGEDYESEFEQILNPIEIENITHKQEWQYAQNVLEEDHEGFQFYVDTRGESSSNTYFYWEIEETFEYHSPFRILYYYDGTIESEGESNFYGIQDMRKQDTLFYCWKTQHLLENLRYSLENLNAQEAHTIPLHFIPFGDERLRYGYNMHIKQYVVSEEANTFLSALEEQNENQGTLFTTQPYQIRGNIFNTQNKSELVLGYFIAASGSVGPRIQVRAPWRRYDDVICYADPSPDFIHHRVSTSTPDEWPIYFTDFPYENNTVFPPVIIFIFAYVAPNCLDCTRHGGHTNKPDFWQEWNKNQESQGTIIIK